MVAVRVTMYVYTDRNPFLLLQYECTLLYTRHGVRNESTWEREYKKQDKVAVRITATDIPIVLLQQCSTN